MLWLAPLMWSAPAAAADLDPPPTGTGFLVTGLIFTGVGGINLLTAPVCKTDFYLDAVGTTELQNVCLGSSLAFAAVGLGVGIPLTVAGARQRREYKYWKETTLSLVVQPRSGGAVAGIAGRF